MDSLLIKESATADCGQTLLWRCHDYEGITLTNPERLAQFRASGVQRAGD